MSDRVTNEPRGKRGGPGRAGASPAGDGAIAIANFFPLKRISARRRNGQAGAPALPELPRISRSLVLVATAIIFSTHNLAFAQVAPAQASPAGDPAAEPSVIAVAKVLPAVVNINTERVVRRTVRDPFDDFYSQFFGYYQRRPREIRQTLTSLGSGFIVDASGYIVTNEHVVERAADLKIQVVTDDNKTYNAHYITGDSKKDLAFIKIDSKEAFPFISLDNISPNLLGQTVIVVGNAVGYGSSISRGVLSAAKRDITIDNIEYKNLIQTDAAINPGNSGGPVIDLSARLVGLSSAKMAFTPQGVPTQGLGFAIPAEVVRDTVAGFRKIADKQPPPKTAGQQSAGSNAERLFGIQLQDLTPDLTDAMSLVPGRGVLISGVEPGSPADEVGIERGLLIYRIGKYDVNSVKQIEKLLARVRTGLTVDFVVGVARNDGSGQRVETVSLAAR
ncbi:MAG TPA: trypsin-like peptidase domain-containing protein [Chthoniobacterales bacterium]|nr:trypsin-like peptidase domain-containing protein [Chthoniobacterales bacterium]